MIISFVLLLLWKYVYFSYKISRKFNVARELLIGTLSNEDGDAAYDSKKQ